jgi:hypothetical protein
MIETTIALSERILGFGAAIAGMEIVATAREWGPNSLAAPDVLSSRYTSPRLNRAIYVVSAHGGILVVGLTYLIMGCVLMLPNVAAWPRIVADLGIVFASALANVVSPFGRDGADQMRKIVALALAGARIATSHEVQVLFLAFIAAQLSLSYVVAGIAKACGPSWRTGVALERILACQHYGFRPAARVLAMSRWIGVIACWLVITLEVVFPLVFVLPPSASYALLAVALGLHVGIAAVMGLNDFLPAFAAAYPIVWEFTVGGSLSLRSIFFNG